MHPVHLAAVIVAGLVAFAVTPLTMALATRLGMLDVPDARKVHRTPTPRLGGIAVFAAMVTVGPACALWLHQRGFADPTTGRQLLAILAAAAFVFLVGLVDDIRGVSPRFKLAALIAAGLVVCGADVTLGEAMFGGRILLSFLWLDWLVTIVYLIGVAVAINFIDGLDGLAGGLGLLTAVVLGCFLTGWQAPITALIPLTLAGALVGFLCHNWHPARTFMGDSGSLTLGFVLATTTLLANDICGTMRGLVLPALALSVPLAEAVLTMFRRRYLQRRSLFSAEQGHIHHQLLDRGFTHRQAVLVIYATSLLVLCVGLVALTLEGWSTLAGLALVPPILWGAFRLAGSFKTNEMLVALRHKRHLDRTSRGYRAHFEQLQLEFNRVHEFAQWWQVVCRAADRLDFISVKLPMLSRDGSSRLLEWHTTCAEYADCTRLTATVPIANRRQDEPLEASVEIAAAVSLESAGERLALFSRLMHEHSLAALERKPRHRIDRGAAGAHVDPGKRLPLTARGPFGDLRVAVVHDFLYVQGGAERVLEHLIELFPHCDLFALFDFLPEDQRGFLRGKEVRTSFLQHMPFASRKHRAYLPLMPLAIEQLNVSQYDLVVSSSHLAAKGVITGPDQLHVCYCHSPARYAWDLQHQYLDEAGLGFGPKGLLARSILHYIRQWDARSSLGVDHYVANSQFVARRIKKLYRREAEVIYPPVDTDYFTPNGEERDDYYVAISRMVPYKRTDLIVSAFADEPQRTLKVIGEGPDFAKVAALAGDNVQLLGHLDQAAMRRVLQRAKGLIFAAEEDFGIVPVEALACGTPVIAYGKGGVTETVRPGEHGEHFGEQTAESLRAALDRFERQDYSDELTQLRLRQQAERFSAQRFSNRLQEKIGQWVVEKWPARAAEKVQRKVEVRTSEASHGEDIHITPSPSSLTTFSSS